MKPYYEHGGITIYHGDCREVLPGLEAVGTICTDPVWPGASVELAGREDPYLLLSCALTLAPAAARLAIQLGCDSDPRFLGAVPAHWEFFRVCWLDVAFPNPKGRLLAGAVPAYFFGEPPPSRPGHQLIPGMYRDSDSSGRGREHPCPRKPGHLRWILSKWAAPGDIILDPFAGIGTTLRAAADLGHPAIGIEIEERYCEIAAKRLAQEALPFEEVARGSHSV